ncbi:MAG: N-acetyl-gamma-glutamyl-phosphate reductase [Lachnospiraceae bacterium]|nr:N-acetyl-gamma-glutamyl-phosphate reductase [Lachnospiraceae bacterium]
MTVYHNTAVGCAGNRRRIELNKTVKVFIDGSEGTTGLRINERFVSRDDIEVLTIDPALRKDPDERARLINSSDYTFLCLPDAASIEAVSLADNPDTVLIDASTAHRTKPDWAYGLPELSPEHFEKIRTSKRIAVPGCYASGFIMMAYPLVTGGILDPGYPFTVPALSGYSGAGKKGIAQYEAEEKAEDLFAPRLYALSQMHKHLPEMKCHAGLTKDPVFIPIVDDYYCGMIVNLPVHADMMKKRMAPKEVRDMYAGHYKDSAFIRVLPYGAESETGGFLSANTMAGKDYANILVTGNDDRILVSAIFDNLGKGASGAAIECMNISMGIDPATGLNV